MVPDGGVPAPQGRRRLRPLVLALILKAGAFVGLLIAFIINLRDLSHVQGADIIVPIVLGTLLALVLMAAVVVIIVLRVRWRTQRAYDALRSRYPDAVVVPVYWSAALLEPAFRPGPWLNTNGGRGFSLTLVASAGRLVLWRPGEDAPFAMVPASAVDRVVAIQVRAPLGGRLIAGLQIDLAAPTERLLAHVQFFPSTETGTQIREEVAMSSIAAAITRSLRA